MAKRLGAAPSRFKEMVEHPDYLRNLQTRLHAGILPPNLEIRILEYVYGKPAEEIDVTMHADFSSKTTDELMALAGTLTSQLQELKEISATIH